MGRLSDNSKRKISTTKWCFHRELSPYTQDLSPKNLPQKASFRSTTASRKWTVNDTTSKGKAIKTSGGTTPSLSNDQPHTTENTTSLSAQGATASVQPLQRHEDLLLQMFTDMNEQMKEQQAQSDPDRKQAALDRENVIRE